MEDDIDWMAKSHGQACTSHADAVHAVIHVSQPENSWTMQCLEAPGNA